MRNNTRAPVTILLLSILSSFPNLLFKHEDIIEAHDQVSLLAKDDRMKGLVLLILNIGAH